jgi:hypothetical protein
MFSRCILADRLDTYNAYDYVSKKPPCCGRCTIAVRDMHLYYWPDFATMIDVSSADSFNTGSAESSKGPALPISWVDENDFTLSVSPVQSGS